jgi:hypothetical protein
VLYVGVSELQTAKAQVLLEILAFLTVAHVPVRPGLEQFAAFHNNVISHGPADAGLRLSNRISEVKTFPLVKGRDAGASLRMVLRVVTAPALRKNPSALRNFAL